MINFWRQGARSQTVYSIQSRKTWQILFFFLSLAMLGLRCCKGFSPFMVSGDYSLVAMPGLLIEVASPVAEHGL